jgi:hypothetical protein
MRLMMTKIFCDKCGARLAITGEPVLSDAEDSYMVNVRHKCHDAALQQLVLSEEDVKRLDSISAIEAFKDIHDD